MLSKIKNLFLDRKRSEEEYKIVIRVLERMNLRHSLYLPLGEFKDQREFDYTDLSKLPEIFDTMTKEYDFLTIKYKQLQTQLRSSEEQAANVSSVIDTILDTVEKRYDLTKQEEHETNSKI